MTASAGSALVGAPETRGAPARPSAGVGRLLPAVALAGVLWLASGGLAQALRWFAGAGSLPGAVLPATMPGSVWVWPGGWGVAAALLGALCVALTALAVLVPLSRAGRLGVVSAWFAVIVAGGFAGAIADVALAVSTLRPGMTLRSALTMHDPAAYAAVGAYWGLISGWAVALLAASGDRRPADRPRGGRPPASTALVVVPALALVAGAAYGVVAVQGARADRVASVQEDAVAGGASEESGALPDPYADGEAVPGAAEADGPRDPSWCAPEEAALLLGDPDAATGHRVLPLRFVNVSEEPCAIRGYPDIAFADQNGFLLDAGVERGSSFMAEDPGPQRVTVEPGGVAVAYLGWNAAATRGELVATTVHAALLPGDPRDSWSGRPSLDIVAGSTVFVTAWAAEEAPG